MAFPRLPSSFSACFTLLLELLAALEHPEFVELPQALLFHLCQTVWLLEEEARSAASCTPCYRSSPFASRLNSPFSCQVRETTALTLLIPSKEQAEAKVKQ